MKSLIVAVTLFSCVSAIAQDYRNDMFRTRSAYHEPRHNKRVEVTQMEERLRPFYHGVASGDPLSDRVVLWTRVTPENADAAVDVDWIVCTDVAMKNGVRSGRVRTTFDRDFTVKVDVDGLQPGTVYYYAFTAYGRSSLIGRTRTTPLVTDHARLAVVSCSNYPAGYFNGYGAIAALNDIDAVLHLGDYIYEYDADTTSYGGSTGARLGRRNDPDAELVSLTDYRTRYAQYRLDPDLRALHQQHPMIHVWDDHESANDAYTDGAENHQPATEGDWNTRKRISKQVCMEWLPTREVPDSTVYRRFTLGSLVDVFMIDTRLDGRSKQVQSADSLADPSRTIMSTRQFNWLVDGMSGSTATWKVIGNQVLVTPVVVEPIDTTYLFEAVGPVFSLFIRAQLPALQDVFTLAFRGDVWSNYPVQQQALFDALRTTPISNAVVVTGDFHSSFAFEVPDATQPVAVEFATPSVTSANFDENLSSVAFLQQIAKELVSTVDTTLKQLNPNAKYIDLTRHGYELVSITPTQTQCDWYYMDTLLVRSTAQSVGKSVRVAAGSSKLTTVSDAAPGKTQQDIPAPAEPPNSPVSVREGANQDAPVTIVSYGPNPSSTAFALSYIVPNNTSHEVLLVASDGTIVYRSNVSFGAGLHSLVFSVADYASGVYSVVVRVGNEQHSTGIVIRK